MARMKFLTRVNYSGAVHGALEPFDVEEKDVAALQGKGGILLEAQQEDADEMPKRRRRKTAEEDASGD